MGGSGPNTTRLTGNRGLESQLASVADHELTDTKGRAAGTVAPAGVVRGRSVLMDRHTSPLAKYRQLVTGQVGVLGLLKYELLTGLLGGLPGLLGLATRSLFYRALFRRVGQRAAIGQHVTIRCPHRIELGNRVVIEDGVLLDAKGDAGEGIIIEDDVFIGRSSILRSQYGTLEIGKGSMISSYCRIGTARIGRNVMIAAYTHILAGGHHAERTDIPMTDQPLEYVGLTELGEGCWIGTQTTVMPGVHVGNDAIVGAHSLVIRDVAPFAVAYGVPARFHRDRRDSDRATDESPSTGSGSVPESVSPAASGSSDAIDSPIRSVLR